MSTWPYPHVCLLSIAMCRFKNEQGEACENYAQLNRKNTVAAKKHSVKYLSKYDIGLWSSDAKVFSHDVSDVG